MLAVYHQRRPIPTGKYFLQDGEEQQWHRANLVLIGVVQTWEEAKQLTPAPVVEEIEQHQPSMRGLFHVWSFRK